MSQTHLLNGKGTLALLGVMLAALVFPPLSDGGGVQLLLSQLNDKNPEVRKKALESKELEICFSPDTAEDCSINKENSEKLINALILLLDDPDAKIRERAVYYLAASTDAKANRPIARLLHDPSPSVRAAAAEAFSLTDVHEKLNFSTEETAAIVSSLEGLLKDQNERVREEASKALVMNGTPKSLMLLREAYARETDQHLRDLFSYRIQEIERRLGSKSSVPGRTERRD